MSPWVGAQWYSSLFACLGRNDKFCSSDLEICKSSSLFNSVSLNMMNFESIELFELDLLLLLLLFKIKVISIFHEIDWLSYKKSMHLC